jgi:hypothetical protein
MNPESADTDPKPGIAVTVVMTPSLFASMILDSEKMANY